MSNPDNSGVLVGGGCLCGAVRFEARGEPLWVSIATVGAAGAQRVRQ